MNFEKFINHKDIDKNYHAVAKLETSISQGKHRSAEQDDHYPGLLDLAGLDFMYRNPSASIDPNSIRSMFEQKCHKDGKKHRSQFQLIFGGPLIKQIVDPFRPTNDNVSKPSIRREVVVHVISRYSTLECLSIKKSNQVTERNGMTYDPRLYYQVDIYDKSGVEYSFFVRKKSSSTVAEAVTSSSDHLDRIALVRNNIWVSGLFVLEYHNRLQTYDHNRTDPVFNYPSDVLDIYDRSTFVTVSKNHGMFKTLIDRADLSGMTTILDEYDTLKEAGQVHTEINVEQAMIVDDQQKYSVIEYLMLSMIRTTHMVILQARRNIMMSLLSRRYVFIRSPLIFARVINFGNYFPSLFMMLANGKKEYPPHLSDISSNAIIEYQISSMYQIDMHLIKTFIQEDDESQFVDYITRIKMVKKLSNPESKTGRMIVDWLILYNPQKIISTLVDTKTLLRSDVFRIIFLTESFEMLDQEIMNYIRYRAQKEDKTHKLIVKPHREHESNNKSDNDSDNRDDIDSDQKSDISDESESVTDTDRDMMDDIEDGKILDREEMEVDIPTQTEEQDRMDVLADELDEDIDAAIQNNKESDLQNRLDQIEEDVNNDSESTESIVDENAHSSYRNDSDSNDSADSDSSNDPHPDTESTASSPIDPEDMLCIIRTLEDVVNSGLSHSFFLIHQLCPQILNDDFLSRRNNDRNVESNAPKPVRNIIHWIRSDTSIEVLQLMLKFRPDIVNSRDHQNLTPLLSLVKSYNPRRHSIEKILVYLLTNDADYEDTDENGDTILHILARKGDNQLVNTVLRLVPSIIDHQNNQMMTPIMVAAQSGDETMVYTLEGGNADTSYVDRDGNSVYHYICRSGICPNSIVPNNPNEFGFRPSDYSIYSDDFYYFRM